MNSEFPLADRIAAFIRLGFQLSDLKEEEMHPLFQEAQNQNAWFTNQSLNQALEGIKILLEKEALELWVSRYSLVEPSHPSQVGLMLAGNIPGVGFHDILAVLISGHVACIKLSSQDTALPLWLLNQLKAIEPRFSDRIFIEDLIKNKQAYIATGSDNSARYFHYYFGKYPHLIRSNRTSVAILQGNESSAEIQALGHDIFDYFGLGCRNISKIYVRDKEQLTSLLDEIQSFEWVANHHKYFNNYEYNKSIYLVNGTPHLDNGFLLLKESVDLVSPISVLYYEMYTNLEDLKEKFQLLDSKIQCMVGGASAILPDLVPFGHTQCPAPWDYADRVDTLKFLQELT